mgnify:FL=1
MLRSVTVCSAILISTLLASGVQAACTYNEAIMAFDNGNLVRGQALMRMAARDGDQRAMYSLASYDQKLDQSRNAGKSLSELLFVLRSSTSMHTTVQN